MIRTILIVILAAAAGSVAYWQYRDYQWCKDAGGVAVRGFWGEVVCVRARP